MNVPRQPAFHESPGLMIGDRDFSALARLVHDESGIVLPVSKKGLVVSRLSRRLRELNLPDFRDYCRLLQSENGTDERANLISALTTNVTKFFREDHHFRSLEKQIFPELIERVRRKGRARIWSAGCSTGEEPYSIAMELLDLCPDARTFDIRILATDIDPQVLSFATAGRYSQTAIAGVPAARRARYFKPVDGSHEASQELRELITFAQLNLVGQWPIRGPFDVIFCRNVVIYFDNATQEALWPRFAALIPPSGHLFIGHSERIGRSAERCFSTNGITQYRRTGVPAGNPGTRE